jgi:Zn finger protein HypA/HybF involved in hydrogenase expression
MNTAESGVLIWIASLTRHYSLVWCDACHGPAIESDYDRVCLRCGKHQTRAGTGEEYGWHDGNPIVGLNRLGTEA